MCGKLPGKRCGEPPGETPGVPSGAAREWRAGWVVSGEQGGKPEASHPTHDQSARRLETRTVLKTVIWSELGVVVICQNEFL